MSSELSQAKILGGTGSILLLLSVVPKVGFVLGIIGLVLILIAGKLISDATADGSVFQNLMISTIFGVVAILVVEFVVLDVLSRITRALRNIARGATGIHFGGRAIELILGLVIICVLFIFYGYFLRKSFNAISQKLNVSLFGTGALIMLIGGALTIIFVGFLILLVGDIVLAIAFFSIPDHLPGTPSTPSSSSPISPSIQSQGSVGPVTTSTGNKICPKCGASIPEGTVFCPSCGQKQI